MRTTIDQKQLETLMASDVFKAIQTAADAKRLESHRAAVNALLAKESDTTEIDAARVAVDEARRKFEPILANYRKAAFSLSEKEINLRDLASSHENTCGQLRRATESHLPDIVHHTESALGFVAHEIRNSLTVQTMQERDWKGSVRNRYESNQGAIDEALAQVEAMRELLARFALEPLPLDEIIQTLSTEAATLIKLSKDCGASAAHHLPAEIRPGLYVEKPERSGPYVIPR